MRTLYPPGGTALITKVPSAAVVATFTGVAFSSVAGISFTVAPTTGGELWVCKLYGPETEPFRVLELGSRRTSMLYNCVPASIVTRVAVANVPRPLNHC